MQVKGRIKHWFYLLCTPIFLDIDKPIHKKYFKNRGILDVLIQQGIMKFKKAKCNVIHMDRVISSTKQSWLGNGLRTALRRTEGCWWMKSWT